MLSLALLVGGGWVAYGEARSYFSAGVTAQEKFAALGDRTEYVGLSTAAKRLALDNCYDGVVSIFARTQPAAARDDVAEACRALTDDIVARSPSHSFAWLVGATAASRLDDVDGVVARLRQSQVTGPAEQWIAELRVALAETYLDRLPADVRALHDSDLELLAASERGVRSIASRYVRDKGFRERITTIVEKMPQAEQQRFLSTVRQAAARVGG